MNRRNFLKGLGLLAVFGAVRKLPKSNAPKPSYNHTRGDSPLTPCDVCKPNSVAAIAKGVFVAYENGGTITQLGFPVIPASSWGRVAGVAACDSVDRQVEVLLSGKV
jgi:hypothetical protein